MSLTPQNFLGGHWPISLAFIAHSMSRSADEILLLRTGFWIVARGQSFGPFDYQWSLDLHGLELLYRGQKFGEICSPDSLFADLTEFQLPMSVCRVAVITLGVIASGVSSGDCVDQKASKLLLALDQFGYSRFQLRAVENERVDEDGSA